MTSPRGQLASIVPGVLVAVAVGVLAPTHPLAALLAAGMVLVLGVAAIDLGLVLVAAVPLLFVVTRVGGESIDLSVSDAALAAMTGAVLFLGSRGLTRPMRTLLWLAVTYQVLTLFTVVVNPYPANLLEWLHTFVLVAGALAVGWNLGRSGRGGQALRVMLVVSVALALLVYVEAARDLAAGSFGPVYVSWPIPMHKNFVGATLAITALIAYVQPPWLGWGPRTCSAIFWVLAVAVALTQSRQAIIGLAVTLTVLVLRTRSDRRRSKAILVLIIPAIWAVITMVRDQVVSGNEFNSVFQRLAWYQDTVSIWSENPWFGVGLRWWYTDRFVDGFQPPNAELEVLSSAGIVGLVGFLILMIGTLVVLGRLDPTYGTLGMLALLCRLVQGQFDLFWTAVHVSVPFVIAGICVGALARAEEGEPPDPRHVTGRTDSPDAQGVSVG